MKKASFLLLLILMGITGMVAVSRVNVPVPTPVIKEVLTLGEIPPLYDPLLRGHFYRPDEQIYAKNVENGWQFFNTNHEPLAIIPLPSTIAYSGLRWSPDGTKVAIPLFHDLGTQIWSVSNDGRTVELLLREEDEYIGWNEDGSRLIHVGEVFDPVTGETLFIRELNDTLHWSPDRSKFVGVVEFCPPDFCAIYGVFNGKTGELLHRMEVGRDWNPRSLSWSPDSQLFTDGWYMWEAATGYVVSVFEGIPGYVGASYLSLVTLHWNTEVRDKYELLLLQNTYTAPEDTETPVSLVVSLQISSDYGIEQTGFAKHFWQWVQDIEWENGQIVTESRGYKITLDAHTGEILDMTHEKQVVFSESLAWSPDSKQLAAVNSGTPDYPLQMWDIAAILAGAPADPTWVNHDWLTYEKQANQYGVTPAKVFWHETGIYTVSDTWLNFHNFYLITHYQTATGVADKTLYFVARKPDDWGLVVVSAEPSPDFTRMARFAAVSDETMLTTVDIVDMATQTVQVNFEASLTEAMWSPDGTKIATTNTFQNESIISIWNTTTGELLNTISTDYWEILWHSDSRHLLVTGAANGFYDVATGQNLIPNTIISGEHFTWSPNGRWLAANTETMIVIYNTNFELVTSTPYGGFIKTLAWSPDGKFLAGGFRSDAIRVWEISGLD